MTIDDMLRILRVSAGDSDDVNFDKSIVDTEFEALGVDSVALLEVTAQIEREFDVDLERDGVHGGYTPRQLVALANVR